MEIEHALFWSDTLLERWKTPTNFAEPNWRFFVSLENRIVWTHYKWPSDIPRGGTWILDDGVVPQQKFFVTQRGNFSCKSTPNRGIFHRKWYPMKDFFLISRLTRRQAKFMSKNETHFCFDSPSYYQGYLWIKKCLIVKTWRWFNITIHTFVTQGLAISSYGSQWTYFRWYQLIQFYSIFFIKRLESPVLLAFPVIITKYWVKKYFKDKLKWTINISLVLFVTRVCDCNLSDFSQGGYQNFKRPDFMTLTFERCPLQLDYVSVWYRLSPDDLKNLI